MLATFADMISIATFRKPMNRPESRRHDRKDELRRMRANLPELNAHLLRDIGLDPSNYNEEEAAPIWRWSPR